MTKIHGLPVYKASIGTGEADGMTCISLVDEPAVMRDFQHFKKEDRIALAKVTDEEKRLIFGVVMRANYPIYRKNEKLGEYFIVYDREAIRTMAEKYIADGNANNVNLQHEDGSEVEGVQMTQYFIKDTAKGICPEGFEDVEDGSLFAEFHCTNDDVWEGVKKGEFKGFSLEGLFGLEPTDAIVSQQKSDADLGLLADAKLAIEEKTNKTQKDMTLLQRIKAALAEGLAAEAQPEKFGSVATEKGTLLWEGDEDLKAGDKVWSEDADGNRIDLEDGDYPTEDGKVIAVEGGEVKEIRDKEAEVAPEEPAENAEEKAQKMRAIVKDHFAKLREAFSYNLNELWEKAYSLIPADTDDLWHYLIELGNDYLVYNEYNYADNSDKNYKLPISVSEDGEMSANGEAVEVKHEWVEVNAAPEEPKEPEAPAEDAETKAENEALKAENKALKAEVDEIKAKLKSPTGKSAHEAFKDKNNLTAPSGNFVDTYRKLCKN